MGRLKIFGTIEDNFKIFSDGNPGALTALFELMKQAEDRTGLFLCYGMIAATEILIK